MRADGVAARRRADAMRVQLTSPRACGRRSFQSVLGDAAVRQVVDRFGERKLQHDLAVSSVTSMVAFNSAPLGAFGLQQLPDHRARDLPGTVGLRSSSPSGSSINSSPIRVLKKYLGMG